MVRGYMMINVVAILVPSAIWIGSIHVEYPKRIALIWIAIFVGRFHSSKCGTRLTHTDYVQMYLVSWEWLPSSG